MSKLTDKSDRKQCLAEEKKKKPLMIKRAVNTINKAIDKQTTDCVKNINNVIDLVSQNIVDCCYTLKFEDIRKEIIKKLSE